PWENPLNKCCRWRKQTRNGQQRRSRRCRWRCHQDKSNSSRRGRSPAVCSYRRDRPGFLTHRFWIRDNLRRSAFGCLPTVGKQEVLGASTCCLMCGGQDSPLCRDRVVPQRSV